MQMGVRLSTHMQIWMCFSWSQQQLRFHPKCGDETLPSHSSNPRGCWHLRWVRLDLCIYYNFKSDAMFSDANNDAVMHSSVSTKHGGTEAKATTTIIL